MSCTPSLVCCYNILIFLIPLSHDFLFLVHIYCRAQRSGARLGNRDVAPVARCSLGPENVKCMSRFWPPGLPYNFGTRDLHPLLGVSKRWYF